MLQHLPAEEAERVIRGSRRHRYAAGQVIFHEDDPGDSMHVILSGRVAVLVTHPLGQQLTYQIMGEGGLVGELSLLMPGGRRSATVQALEATETLAIGRREFERLLREHPPVSLLLVRLLTDHVLRLSERLREMLYLPVEARIRRRLIDVAQTYGGVAAGTVVRLRQDDLASLSGAARATVNRVLRQDAIDGIVALERRRVIILDAERLRRRARLDD
ncbi:MAG TPA: Crp/Fnr family transcriptional regulator [Candidatus Dormibacteraeota bacterium]|nr:Crp/Fnr family transcriptional regulator [Candidatus Dormibacteraeota bacterium]